MSLLLVVSFVPSAGAQAYRTPTPAPVVNAARADWQLSRQAIFAEGYYYYPAGSTVFFDGSTMTVSGVYRGVPLYADVTLEPHSVVFVPIGRGEMRPYERRREGELAGTTGSRTPSFPIQRDVELSAGAARFVAETSPAAAGAPGPSGPGTDVHDGHACCCCPSRTGEQETVATAPAAMPGALQSVPGPEPGADGVWIDFEGRRWYSDGPAVLHDPQRFVPAGNYRGFLVYRERTATDRIHVTVVSGGLLAPFVPR